MKTPEVFKLAHPQIRVYHQYTVVITLLNPDAFKLPLIPGVDVMVQQAPLKMGSDDSSRPSPYEYTGT